MRAKHPHPRVKKPAQPALVAGFWATGLIVMSLFVATGAARAERFLSAAADIPLAAGLVELSDGVLVFDKPQGRIVQFTAVRQTGLTPEAVAAFYRDSLPNLGWQSQNEQSGILTFARREEILRLTFTADLVIFDVTPRRAE